LRIGNYEIAKINNSQKEIDVPPINLLKSEISFADSSYYTKYMLKPYNPATLYQKHGNYDVYDEMREDDQIKSVLTLKKLIILNSEWEIESENEEIKKFIENCLCEYIDESFTQKLYQILSAMDYGFSVTEKIMDSIDTEYGQKFVFTKLKTRAPHTFLFETDSQGNLSKLIQHTGHGDIPIDPKKFIIFSWNKEFDDFYGNSELNKGVYRAWWSKDAIIKFWNIYLERFGMPTAVGKLPRNAGEGDKNRFKDIIKNIQAKTGVIIPDDFSLEFLKGMDGASSASYEAAIDKYNTMIARSMLQPDLLGFSGSKTGGGSYALGEEQFNIFYTSIEYCRHELERIINKEIIRLLVAYNYGVKEEAVFKFKHIDQKKKSEDLKLWVDAIKSGKIPTSNELINWFLKNVNAPEISEEDLNKIEEDKQAFKNQLNKKEEETNDGMLNEKKASEETINPEDNKTIQENISKKQFEMLNEGLSREPNQYELKMDFTKLVRDTENIEQKYIDELAKQFKLSINALVWEIKDKGIIEKKRLYLVNKLDLKYMSKITQIFRNMLKDAWNLGANQKIKKNYALIDTNTNINDEDIANWINENVTYITGVEQNEILDKVKGVLIDSITNGFSPNDAIKKISDILEPYDLSTRTALEKSTRIETIVRTNVNKAYNQAHAKQMQALGDEIVAYEYSSIMDSRTSSICRSLDGKIFKPSQLYNYLPPRHYRCRSTIVPIFKDETFEFSNMPSSDQLQEEGGF
jgi:SPP1 gp7 family putative phage head morphogenesis protein